MGIKCDFKMAIMDNKIVTVHKPTASYKNF